jgi:hypothetical protein
MATIISTAGALELGILLLVMAEADSTVEADTTMAGEGTAAIARKSIGSACGTRVFIAAAGASPSNVEYASRVYRFSVARVSRWPAQAVSVCLGSVETI